MPKKLSECEYKVDGVLCPRCDTFFIDDLPKTEASPLCPKDGKKMIRGFDIKGATAYDVRGRMYRRLRRDEID